MSNAIRVGEHSAVVWKRLYFNPFAARLSNVGIWHGLSDEQLATQVAAFNWTAEMGSIFIVQATARPGKSLAEIEQRIGDEISRLAKEGPSAAEVERAKTKQESEFISGLERIGGFGGKADVLNQYNVYLGDPNKMDADLARYRKLTPADIEEVSAAVPKGAASGDRYPAGGMKGVYL